ncbi:unnamed protein product [Arctia plantaginis]|uniref:Uncharacterized protein n=1 Tax=Arctia plantaginis TaxID=874455 RepID=A0A8S1AIS4_ARCPL|nr:unnamed protein product [Arctia plantaginis]
MTTKSILVLCASVCLFKMNSAQCIGSINGLAGSLIADEMALGGNALPYRGLGPFGAAGYGAPGEGVAPAMGPAAYPAGPGVQGAFGYPGVAGQRSLNGLSPASSLGYRGVY